MSYGGIKKYHLIHLDFSKNIYCIYEYEKDRRLTANQAWHMIHHTEPSIKDKLSNRSTIFDYFSIIEKLGYEEKYCDRYCTFRCV